MTTKQYNVNVITTNVSNKILPSFPELCSNLNYGMRTPNIENVSIAISGGGPRSYGNSIGVYRALNRMGLKNKEQYASTVSGGSWFYGTYRYVQSSDPNLYTDSNILGTSCGTMGEHEIPNPSKITLDELKKNNSHRDFMGNRFTEGDILNYMYNSISNGDGARNLWSNSVGQMLLEYYKLDNRPIALNQLHANSMYGLNPLILEDSCPFWICNSILLFEYAGVQYPYLIVPMTPLYSGIPQIYTDTLTGNTIGGIVIDNFAFGGTDPPSQALYQVGKQNCGKTSYSLKTKKVQCLKDMLGTSSSAYAGAFASSDLQKSVTSILPLFFVAMKSAGYDILDLIPTYNIWGSLPEIPTTTDKQCLYTVNNGCVAKNGFLQNTCTNYLNSCYTNNTTKQCKTDSNCSFDTKNLSCTSNTGSNLNCRIGLKGCKCVTSATKTPATVTPSKIAPPSTNKPLVLYNQKAQIGDGCLTDNSGILSLLARKVKKIIAFSATDKYVDDSIGVDITVSALFGVDTIDGLLTNLAMNTQKVFEIKDHKLMIDQFKTRFALKQPVYARMFLNVLQNKTFGIEGGYIVDLLVIVPQTTYNFNNNLTKDVLKEITNDNTDKWIYSNGILNNFPGFKTTLQNSTLGLVRFTLPQMNILSTYADWYLNQPEIRKHIYEMYGADIIYPDKFSTNERKSFTFDNKVSTNIFRSGTSFTLSNLTIGYDYSGSSKIEVTYNIEIMKSDNTVMFNIIETEMIDGSCSILKTFNITSLPIIETDYKVVLRLTSAESDFSSNLSNVFIVAIPEYDQISNPNVKTDSGETDNTDIATPDTYDIKTILLYIFGVIGIISVLSFFIYLALRKTN